MKNIIILITILVSIQISQAQVEVPNGNEILDRIPELPTLCPTGIRVDPTPIEIPVPPPPTVNTPVFVPPAGNDDRHVYWVHGFGNNWEAWNNAKTASESSNANTQGFQARRIESFAPSYSQNGTLLGAAEDLGDEIEKENNNRNLTVEQRKDNFIIGHSQGGIVSRYLVWADHCSPSPIAKNEYGGLVTFGSSLNGAQIINSRNDDLIANLGAEACKIFLDQLIAGVPKIILNKLGIDRNGTIGDSLDLCNFLSTNALELMLSDLKEGSVSDQYSVGHPEVDAMNSCVPQDTTFASVAFYGVEPYEPLENVMFENPIFYRTMRHMTDDVNGNNYGYWGANDDSKLALKADTLANKTLLKAEEFAKEAAIFRILALSTIIPNPIYLLRARNFDRKAAAAWRAYQFYHDINDKWLAIIGAVETYVYNDPDAGYCRCDYNPHEEYWEEIISNATTSADCLDLNDGEYHQDLSNCIWIHNSSFVQVGRKPSDGIVLQESAQHMVGASHDPVKLELDDNYSLPGEINTGSSHMQMRNDRNLRVALSKLYDGKFGDFFETAVR